MAESVKEIWFEEGLRFKCTGCGGCCTGTPGYVYLSQTDLERLAEHFKMSQKEFAETYTQKEGEFYVLRDRPGSYDCTFLKNNRCSVYEARPTQCRTFPWWAYHLNEKKDWEEAAKRCEGINHPDAELVPSLHIQEQCLTYLDNLLDQNFIIED